MFIVRKKGMVVPVSLWWCRHLGSRSRWIWWHTPVIPKLRRLRQEDPEFEASIVELALSQKEN